MKLKIRALHVLLWMVFMFLFVRVDFRFRFDDMSGLKGSCACTSCASEPQDDPWFSERFDSRVPKFMNRRNSNISAVTKNWWLVSSCFLSVCYII